MVMHRSVLALSHNPEFMTALHARCEDAIACQMASSVSDAVGALKHTYFSLVLIDLVHRGDDREHEQRIRAARELLAELDCAEVEARYGFHRILVAISGPVDPVDRLLVELGAAGVGAFERCTGYDNSTVVARLHARIVELLDSRPVSRTALCSAGGGITGIYFELGALKALDDCFGESRGVNEFDMYFGISAGAVVNSLLAAGFTIDAIMAAIAGAPGPIPPISMQLLRWSHVNGPDLRQRFVRAGRAGWRVFWDVLSRRPADVDSTLFRLADLIGPPLHSTAYGDMLHRVLTLNGGSDEFRALNRPLFVGASDQDTHEHVLFGGEGWDHVPVSRAVQASLSLPPAFGAVNLAGHYYEDGAITRTSNFQEAIRRGANLIVLLDPFVPYVSRTPGHGRRRGVLYNIDQSIRTLTFTRFRQTLSYVLRQHPEVSTYTFLPANRERALLSDNPMDHRGYLPIWRGAYLSTVRRVRRLAHRLAGDLAHHGFVLDLARADAVSERLLATPNPTLNDFYPDGVRSGTNRPTIGSAAPSFAPLSVQTGA